LTFRGFAAGDAQQIHPRIPFLSASAVLAGRAWDTQKIKEYYDPQDDGTVAGRKAVMGALSLYLDFINMFMMFLRLFGDRR
jgi:FtsH-binding integral membrane protein